MVTPFLSFLLPLSLKSIKGEKMKKERMLDKYMRILKVKIAMQQLKKIKGYRDDLRNICSGNADSTLRSAKSVWDI